MTTNDRLAGVIGGMGPDATIDFMSRVLSHTPADIDQDHVRMVVEHNPRIPSRQQAMRGEGEDPGSAIARMAARLESMGADFIVMPCNLAHAWKDDILESTSVPFVSIVTESVTAALDFADDGAIGLMTTPGCFESGIYQDALAGKGIVLQTPDELATTMSLVKNIKSGNKSAVVATGLREQAERLVARGATSLIAACTEFPLVLDDSMFDVPFISSTDVLAKKTVSLALCREPLPER